MSIAQQKVAPLVAGDILTWEEFEARWNAAPEIKFAELIGGRVYMPPPVGTQYGNVDLRIHTLLGLYISQTPGCDAGNNSTIRMLGDAPQPDAWMRIQENFGGQSRDDGPYIQGAPELVVEVCLSSVAHDLHEKKDLYRRAGVREYIAIVQYDNKMLWHRLIGDKYELIQPAKGITRSLVFPGFWLMEDAVLKRDLPRCRAILNEGFASPEYAKFVGDLSARRI